MFSPRPLCSPCTQVRHPRTLEQLRERLVACSMCRVDIALRGAHCGEGVRLRVRAERTFGVEAVAEVVSQAAKIAIEEGMETFATLEHVDVDNAMGMESYATNPPPEPEPEPEPELQIDWITWTKIAHARHDGETTACGFNIPAKAKAAGDDQRRCKNCLDALPSG